MVSDLVSMMDSSNTTLFYVRLSGILERDNLLALDRNRKWNHGTTFLIVILDGVRIAGRHELATDQLVEDCENIGYDVDYFKDCNKRVSIIIPIFYFW